MSNRRRLLIGLGAGALAAPLTSISQQQRHVWRIGVLMPGAESGWAPMVDALRSGLRDLGYAEGKNISLEYRWADGQYDRLPSLAADLVRLKVDVIVTNATVGVGAARKATTSIPIVMAAIGDAVASGYVTNLSRPGANVTGLSFFAMEIVVKRLELLKEAVPDLRRVVFLKDQTIPGAYATAMVDAARTTKIALELVDLKSAANLENAFLELEKKRVGGVVVMETPTLISIGKQIGATASRHRLAIIGFREVAEGGGLLAYGADIAQMYRQSAAYVDKILRGQKPGDLPVERASKFELVVNKNAAAMLSVKIPDSILLRATQVIG